MTVRAAGMRGFEDLMRSLGFDPEPLMAEVGIPVTALTDDEERISLIALVQLMEGAARKANRLDLGLRLAEKQDISILGPLAIAMQNASTVGDALDICSRFLHTHSPGIRLSMHELGDDRLALRIRLIVPSWLPQIQVLEQCLTDLHHFCALLAGNTEIFSEALIAVQLPHAACAELDSYQQSFGIAPEFSQDAAQLVVKPELIAASLSNASAELHRLSRDYLQLAYAPMEASMTEQVESVLARALSSTRGRREVIANLLNVHPRTLQRRLLEEGTQFKTLVDVARREQSLRWLTTSTVPLAQLAGLVGLADQTVLNRNCQRWFGATPGEIRAKRGR